MGTKATMEERDRRFERIREAMREKGFDALIIAGKGHGWTGRGYFRYLTDFHIWGHDGLILFPLDSEPVLNFTSGGVANMIAERGWITDVYGVGNLDWDLPKKIIEVMKHRGLDNGKVGIVGKKMILPAGCYEQFQDGLPNVEFVDADRMMDRIRAIKSPLEIQQIKELWKDAVDAMERFVEVLEPGKTERELSAAPVELLQSRGVRQYLVFLNGIPGDDIVDLEGVVKYHMEICGESGHWNEITVQPTYEPHPSEQDMKLMETELRAYDEILKAATPGTTLNELAEVFERVLREDGWDITEENKELEHLDFHGGGLDWLEFPGWTPATPELHDTKLEAGMYLCYHPYRLLEQDVGRTGINDGMIITEDGGERIYPDWDLNYRFMD